MNAGVFLGIQLLGFYQITLPACADATSNFCAQKIEKVVDGVLIQEFFACKDNQVTLSVYRSDTLIKQYQVGLRNGFFIDMAFCDITKGLGQFYWRTGADKKQRAAISMELYGEDENLHWSEKMVIIRLQVSIAGKKEIFEVDAASFCDLDSWRRQVKERYKKWYTPQRDHLFYNRTSLDVSKLRRAALEFNYSSKRTLPLTEEEVDNYFLGIKVVDIS